MPKTIPAFVTAIAERTLCKKSKNYQGNLKQGLLLLCLSVFPYTILETYRYLTVLLVGDSALFTKTISAGLKI